MTNQAKTDFIICQCGARGEFLSYFKKYEAQQTFNLTSNESKFLTQLKQPKILNKLGYVLKEPDDNKIDLAFEEAIEDYEKSIMYFAGIKLWSNHRSTFREHKKYYGNCLTKLFIMSIVNFNNRMKQYGELLHYLPPPSWRKCKKSADADWDERKVTKNEIRVVTYDALPQDYQTHINSQYKADWQDMDDTDFLDAMLSYDCLLYTSPSPRD